MAEENQPNPFQTTYRLVVMAGTLACGSMAAYHFGPPPDRLAALINSAALYAGVTAAPDALASGSDSFTAGADAPAPFELETAPEHRLEFPASFAAAEAAPFPVQQASYAAAAPSAPAPQPEVRPIGVGADRVYQAVMTKPVPASDGVLKMQIDAIGDTPEQAAQRLAAKLAARPVR